MGTTKITKDAKKILARGARAVAWPNGGDEPLSARSLGDLGVLGGELARTSGSGVSF
jgi:hypothetical protein